MNTQEKKFPIYKFSFRWHQDNFENNGTGFNRIFKEEPTHEELQQIVDDTVKRTNEKYKVTEWLKEDYEFKEYESWALIWFQHITFNQFETDEEVERSFSDFVDRKKMINLKNGHYESDMREGNDSPYYCLMGAEDRWRWNICRCEHCLEQGKITVDH
jgi:hypothetical protein